MPSSSNSNRVKAFVVRKLLRLRHGAQFLNDGVSPPESLEHVCPTARNGQLSGNRGWGGEEAECYDRDAGLPAVLAYASEKALRPTSGRPHHGNEDGTEGLRRVMGSSHRAAS